MRYLSAATLIASALLSPSVIFAQAQNLSIKNYQQVSREQATQRQDFVVYRADLANSGPALGTATATLTSLDPFSVRTVPGQDTLTFEHVPARGQISSTNTFKILVTNGVPFDFTKLQWDFQTTAAGPLANAGPNQFVRVGTTAILNGSGSTNPSGAGTLTYKWEMPSRPSGTSTRLVDGSSPIASFFVDVPGDYQLKLTVSNGVASDVATTIVSTTSTPAPVANAGPNQIVAVGAQVVLNGAGSTSGSGNPLTYAWTLINRPAGSTAALTGASGVSPTFVADKSGSYQAQLIVSDGGQSSTPSTVTISTQGVKPVANAGPNQVVTQGTAVQLDGTGSTDAGGLPLTYLWSVISLPEGSTAALSNATSVTPTFTADKPGTYVAQLIVNNGNLSSDPSNVTIKINPGLAPVANAGINQTVQRNSTVQLNGSGTDPQNLPLTFKWSLINKPAGSIAALSNTTIANPTFLADQNGNYVAQLVVNNGTANSAPSTVTISTTCAPPTANAGPNQNVTVGATVFLDGHASGDVCSGPLTYSWSLINRPAGSAATLNGATTVSPAFVADVAGTYVAQLIVNNGFTNSNPVTVSIVAAPNISGNTISFSPASVSICGNGTQTLTVNLSSPAGTGGLTINFSSDNPGVATVPPAMFIPANASSANVTVTGVAAGSANIHASALPNVPDATAPVTVTACSGIILPSNVTLALGDSTVFPLALSAPAPPGGVFISVETSDANIVGLSRATALVNEGQKTPSSSPRLLANGYGTATITASAYGFPTASQKVVVSAGTLTFAPPTLSITGAVTQNLTLTVSAPLASGVAISLSSSDPTVASVPSSVNLPAGALSVTVPVTGLKQGTATIRAGGSVFADTTATVSVNIPGQVNLPANVTVPLGQSVSFPVNLTSGAGPGGITINLAGDSKVSISPSSVFIAAGATTPGSQPQITGIDIGIGTITAQAQGSSSVRQTVQVTGSISFSGGIGVTPGGTGNLVLNLSGPAPAGGFAVNLTSGNTGVATVSVPSVTIPAGATSIPVPVTGVAAGTTTIAASAPNVASATATVTVNPGSIVLPNNLTVPLGQSVPFAITLSAPAGSNVTITLTSGDTNKVTVPATVVIPQGSTTPVNQPQVTGVGTGLTTISAAAPGYTGSTQPILVTGGLSFAGPLTVAAGGSGNLALNLTSGQAPAAGLTLSLTSSNTAFATVPPTVTIPGGGTSATVPVTGVAQGVATITASAPNIGNATTSVTVGAAGTIVLPGNTTVALGQSTAFTVSLAAAAQSSTTVTLISNDTSKLTISPGIVVIPQGSTTPVSQPQVTGIGVGTATVTASAPNFAPVTVPIQVTGPTLSFAPNTLSIGASGTGTLTLNLSTPAPPSGFTINLSSSNTAAATVPGTVNFPANSTSASFTVTGVAAGSAVIHASALPNIADTTATVTVNAPLTILLPAGVSVSLGQSAPFAVTLSSPAPSNVSIDLNSSDTSKVTISPASVAIVQGQTAPAVQPQVTGVSGGSANISASASGFTSATRSVQVTTPTVSFPAGTLQVNAGGTANLVLTLSTTAPPGGLTINLSSSNTAAATVPSTVSFVTGSSTANVAVTGVSQGSAVIHASALPNIPDTSANVTVNAPPSILLPNNFTVPVGLAAAFTVTLSAPSASAVTVDLNSNDSSKVSISPSSVVIPAGALTPASQPMATGVSSGSALISASAPGYLPASVTVQAAPTSAVFSPANLPINLLPPVPPAQNPDNVQQNLTLSLSNPAPAGGATVNLNSTNPSVASVPATVSFPAGAAFAIVPVTGKAPGFATITASGPGLSASAAVTVTTLCGTCINVGNSFVGNHLQSLVIVTLPKPFVAKALLNVSSSDPGKLLVSGRIDAAGQGAVSVNVPAGETTVNLYIQGLADSGTVTIIASFPDAGYSDGTGIVTLSPSGFILTGPNGTGQPFSIGQGASTTLTMQPARLDSFGNVIQVQPLAGGASATVAVNASPANGGSLAPASVSFLGGEDTKTTQFKGADPGVATITAVQPAGFSTPSQSGSSLAATVSAAALAPSGATVGRGLEAAARVLLTAPAPFLMQITLTSNDPAKLLLSNAKDGQGSPSITVLVPGGFSNTQDFYVYGLTASGTATYTATAQGFTSGTGTVNLAPSGIILSGPGGIGSGSFSTTPQLGSTPISVYSVLLDPSLNYVGRQAVAGGSSVGASLSSSSQSVGTFNPPSVSIAGGSDTGTTQFQPGNAGQTTLSVNVPPGFSQSNQYRTIAATVVTSGIGIVPPSVTIGNKLQTSASIIIPGAAQNEVTVTITSNNPNQLLLSGLASGGGLPSIIAKIAPGGNLATFFLQGFAASGQATYTASVPGYQSRTGTVNFAPSAIVISGPLGLDTFHHKSFDTDAFLSRGSTDLTISLGTLDPSTGNFLDNQSLAGGLSLSLPVTNTDDTVGTVSTPVSITGGTATLNPRFLPWKLGTTTVSVPVPPGFSANTYSSVNVTVKP